VLAPFPYPRVHLLWTKYAQTIAFRASARPTELLQVAGRIRGLGVMQFGAQGSQGARCVGQARGYREEQIVGRASNERTFEGEQTERVHVQLHQSPRTFEKPTSVHTLESEAEVSYEQCPCWRCQRMRWSVWRWVGGLGKGVTQSTASF
jgi:hypothetical protein